MNILLTGATGLLGKAFLESANKKYKIYPTYSGKGALGDKSPFFPLDITKKEEVFNAFVKCKPSIVVHTASLGNVDYCEKHQEEAYSVNVTGTKNIIEACDLYKAKLIFTSSNAVFDGNNAPYFDTSKTAPVNFYGKTKVMAEDSIKNSGIRYVIARMILMYGWNNKSQRKNPVTWLIERLKQGEKTFIVNDTYTNPLLNIQAAECLWKIISLDKEGIYNIAGGQRVNRYDFALETAKIFGLNSDLITSVSSDYFKGIAIRMPDTTFDTKKLEKDLSIKPFSIKEGLLYMKTHPIVNE